MFGPVTHPTPAPWSRLALTLMAVATVLMAGVLAYAILLSDRASGRLADLDRCAVAQARCRALYATGLADLPAEPAELAAAHAALPADAEVQSAWDRLSAAAAAGPVGWDAAAGYQGAVDRLADGFRSQARRESARADRLSAVGLFSLVLVATAVALLLVRLRRAGERLEEQEQSFRAFLDGSPVIAYVKDAAGRYRYVSRVGRERFGLAAGSVAGDALPPEAAAAVETSDSQVLQVGRPSAAEVSATEADGTESHWLATKFPLPAGRETLLGGVAVDVTDRRRAEAGLRASEERLRQVVALLPAVVCVADPDGTVVLHEGHGLEPLGRKPGEGVGRPFGELPRAGPVHPLPLALALAGREQLLSATVDGRAFDVHYLPRRDPAGRVVQAVAVAVDVTDREAKARRLEAARSELEGLARRDPLTGLPNRRSLDEQFAAEAARAGRLGHPLAVVLADVDHFKRLNDAHGHPAGDRALAAVAAALRAAAREGDTVARYGGEEFVVLLPGADGETAAVAAERMRRAVAGLTGGPRLTASFGVAGWRPGGDPPAPAELLAAADQALYRAKAGGRDRVECACPASELVAAGS